jgi:hypothetical protein
MRIPAPVVIILRRSRMAIHSSGESGKRHSSGAVMPMAATARAAEVTPKGAWRSEAPRLRG